VSVTLLGFPWDASSSHARGAALAPAIIRTVLASDASSPYSLSGVDVREAITSNDFTELPSAPKECRKAISARIGAVLSVGAKPLSLGGDHSITYPILCAMRDKHGPVNVLHIDAHPDLYDEFEDDKYSHACPFARALEDNCIGNLVQVGIRSVSPEQRKLAAKHNVDMLGADEIDQIPYDRLEGLVYVSIDLDGLDPAFAPGVSHPEPGGLSTREVLTLLSRLCVRPVGADIVEYNPERDTNLTTALVAARLVKEIAAMMA